jgi:hypothetical protein
MNDSGWFYFDDNRNRPGPNYLRMNDMEWLDPAAIRDHEFPEYCKPGFVPFAFTGLGDHWCWYPVESIDGIAPVVLCPHDCNAGEFYAPSFLGSIYRQVLDYATDYFDADDETMSREHLARWRDVLGPLFPLNWRSTLDRLPTAPIVSWELGKSKMFGVLTPDENTRIVHRDLAFAKLNEKFRWMRD